MPENPPEPTLIQDEAAIARARQESGPAPEPPPGYRLEQRLGEGSFGQVWSGVQLRTGQRVAVKFLQASGGTDWDYLRREVALLREVASHPFVIGLLDADLEAATPYYVMPLLARSLEDEHRPPVAKAVEWIRQLAVGLRYLHDKGLLHCDLKPSNVLLDEEQRVRLADFGQSRSSREEQGSYGTLGFMPPEQFAADAHPDVKWDVYSFGATCYTLLTGQYPRLTQADTTSLGSSGRSEMLARYRELLHARALVPVRGSRPDVDPELAAILQACLAIDPDARTPSMHQVVDDLQRWKEREPLLCRRPWSRSYRLNRFVSKPLVAISLFLVAFCPLFVNTYLTMKTRSLLASEVRCRARDLNDLARRQLADALAPRREKLAELATRPLSGDHLEGFQNLVVVEPSGRILSRVAPWPDSLPQMGTSTLLSPPGERFWILTPMADRGHFLAGALPYASLRQMVESWSSPGRTFLLLSAEGRPLWPGVSAYDLAAIESEAGDSLSGRYHNPRGQDVIGVHNKLDGFVLVTELPADEALAGAQEVLVKNRWLNLMVLGAVILLCLLAGTRQAGNLEKEAGRA